MSYILEALKKSQQERSRGQVPDLQSLHPAMVVADRELPRWPYWALGVSLLALAFLLGWLRPWSGGTDNVPAVDWPLPVMAEVVEADKPASMAPASTEPARGDRVIPAPPPKTPQSAPRQAIQPVVDSAGIMDITQLPVQVQQSVPQMSFAGHVYSSNPLHRSVIINGRYMNEGDELMPGMRLVQITPDSVVFDTQQQKFKVTVLHDWSFQ